MNLELFINKQQSKFCWSTKDHSDHLIINIVAKGRIGMSFTLLYYWKGVYVCKFSTFLKTNIFRGFFTSEKVMCVKSIFDMFLTPIAYDSKRNYLKPTSGGMLCPPQTWRILNSSHNFWMKITKVGICVLWMFIPTLCCFGGVPLFLVLFMENIELVIQWWNLEKQVLSIAWIICHSIPWTIFEIQIAMLGV